jgi:hypothetical protein
LYVRPSSLDCPIEYLSPSLLNLNASLYASDFTSQLSIASVPSSRRLRWPCEALLERFEVDMEAPACNSLDVSFRATSFADAFRALLVALLYKSECFKVCIYFNYLRKLRETGSTKVIKYTERKKMLKQVDY